MQRGLLWAAALLALGCQPLSRGPRPASRITLVNPDDVEATEFLRETPGTVPVILEREPGWLGLAFADGFFIQGRRVARIRPGRRLRVYLAPGIYRLSIGPTCQCGGGFIEIQAPVSPADPPTYRISITPGLDVAIARAGA
jgi:hypothetical protein